MINEIKRALLKKSNLVLILLIVCLMLLNTYYSGWRTSLLAGSSNDFLHSEDALFFKKYYGNVFRVWKDSYYMIQALVPLILITPYMLTYFEEKSNKFRYLMISRKGNTKYIFQKVIAIAFSGTIVLVAAEVTFALVTYVFTYHDISMEFIENLVIYKYPFFLQHPYIYFLSILLMQTIYYFCFLVFSIGITAFLKNKVAIIIMPFLAVGILDMLLPISVQPNVVMQPIVSTQYSTYGFCFLVFVYIVCGASLIILSEYYYLKQGN